MPDDLMNLDPIDLAEACSTQLAAFYINTGMPYRLSQLGFSREDLPLIARDALKNFNANPGERDEAQEEEHLDLLKAAW